MRICECGKPVFGTDKKTNIGYCKFCQYKRTDKVNKSTKNKVRSLGDNESNKVMVENNAAKQRWFNERRKEMKGFCQNCGGKSCKDSDEYFRFSIAHILPKAYFKSVATHPLNWIELCHFQNSCHSQMDNCMLDLIDMNCFDTIIERFVKIYPSIAQEERRRIPSILMEYFKNETF